MPLSRGQNRIIHVARTQLGMDEDTYRTILLKIADVASSKDLTPTGFDAVMGYFEYLGFEPRHAVGPYYGERERTGMASPGQVQLIRDLWARYQGTPDWAALDAWLARCFKVSSLRFATKTTAGKVIHALREMSTRDCGARRKQAAR